MEDSASGSGEGPRGREGARRTGARRAGIRDRARASCLHLGAITVLVLISFGQRIGQTTFDTKFDLTADPGRMLGKSLNLWVTGIDLGGLADQGYGYLFPQGTFFLLGDLMAVPDWITQRAWSALVLLVAYDGARRLARALGIGAGTATTKLPPGLVSSIPVLVGAAYALSPRLVGLSGELSSEMLPSAVLPWVCLPIVLALSGRLSARRAAVLAALAVVAMGGVNATENLLALPLPLFLVLAGVRSVEGRRLARWWVACTTLASLWWMLPLLLLGRYSPPFLDYIETAATTTRTTGWSNTVRGTEHWLNYISQGGGPFWAGAHAMSTALALVVLGGVIAAFGVAGLGRTGTGALRFRGPLVLAFLTGLVVMTWGHGGAAGSPFAGGVRHLLDGGLEPFRNIHKADPLVRLPLVLGFGASLAALVAAPRVRLPSAKPFVVLAAGVLVLASAAPVFTGSLRHPGWDKIPASWQQAASWLDHDGPGATLVVPAAGFAEQTWGWTVDEPIQGLASSGWVTRNQIPLIPSASIRLLDGIDARLDDGLGSDALAPTLAASGITRILLRNDLDPSISDATDADRVATALAASPGIERVKTFGAPALPALEVYRVSGARARPDATVSATLPVLTGAPEDVLTAREAGLVGPGEHVLVGRAAAGAAPAIVTDGYRLVERDFGLTHDAVSDVRTPSEPSRTDRKVVDYTGAPGVPRVYARFGALRSVTASTSAGYADSLGPVRPEYGPSAVADDDPSTSWRSAPFTTARGQWVQYGLTRARPIGKVTVLAGSGGADSLRVTRLAVSAGSARQVVTPDAGGTAVVDFGSQVAARVRVTVLGISGHRPTAQVAIRDIAVTGVDTSRTLVVPDTAADAGTSFVFSSDPPRRPCLYGALGTTCDPAYARPGAERGHLDRTFTVHGSGSWRFSGEVVAQPSTDTAKLLLPVGTGLSASSTSVLGDDPAVSAVFATDDQSDTSWLAARGDLAPVLQLTWHKPCTLSRLQVTASAIPALSPYEAVIEAHGQTRRVPLGAGQLGYFKAIPGATSARITLLAHRDSEHLGRSVGAGEVRLDGLASLARPVPLSWTFTSPCGLGPDLQVDGQTYRTQVTGTLGDVVDGRTMSWRSCDGAIALSSGTSRLQANASGIFDPTRVVLRSGEAPASGPVAVTEQRAVTGASKLAPSMRVTIAAGPTSVLVFGQNANPGWQATLAGHDLATRVVDGWQQGFVIPAGAGGTVRIDFAPQTAYRAALGLGGAGVLVLLVLLLIDLRRPQSPLAVRGVIAPRRRAGRLAVATAGMLVLAAVSPVAAAAALVGVFLVRRTPVPVAAAVLVLASGVAAAFAGGTAGGTPGAAADVLAALGCGLVAATLVAAFVRRADDVDA
ncbi:MAG: hypothetical protein JWP74_630 [Marmoricola sp.]|nr:hypothetical protein [Marmoricola sp.]